LDIYIRGRRIFLTVMLRNTDSSLRSIIVKVGLDVLSLALRPARGASLRRWANIVALALIAVAAAVTTSLTLHAPVKRFAALWQGLPLPLMAAVLVIFLALACVPLVRLGGLHSGLWRSLLVYPPAWMSAALAALALFCLGFTRWAGPLTDVDGETWVCSLGILIAAPVVCLVSLWVLGDAPASRPRHRPPELELAGGGSLAALVRDPEGRLIPWLEQERPVEDPERDDLFDLRFVAERIAEHFFDPTLATVGLVGPLGVGKSSILRFVEHCLYENRAFQSRVAARYRAQGTGSGLAYQRPPRILVCHVSAWGLRDKPAAVVILRHAVERLAKEADCLAISSLPERYAKALKGVGPDWLNLPTIFTSDDDAAEQLRRMEPVLEALHARLVIFIEDLDRDVDAPEVTLDQEIRRATTAARGGQKAGGHGVNRTQVTSKVSTRSTGRVTCELGALFSRLVGLDRVSFVLAVSHPGVVDLSRLCEHIEPVRRIERAPVLDVVAALRDHALDWARNQGDLQPAFDSTLACLGRIKDYGDLDISALGGRTPTSALSELLATPRVLKLALRNTWRTWRDLHGEIDFDDLLVCHVIRAASPQAFDFLIDSSRAFFGAGHDVERLDQIRNEWDTDLRDVTSDERDFLWNLLGFLLPATGIGGEVRIPAPPQGVHRLPYFDRVVRGRVVDSVTDQRVLRAIAAWKKNHGDTAMANELATDGAFTAAFERVVQGAPRADFQLAGNEFQELTGQVLAIGLDVHGAEANEETIPGFIPLWRCAKHIPPTADREEWLWQLIREALPRSLALANSLEYCWGEARPDAPQMEATERLRKQMVEWAKENLTPECLARSLGRSDPMALLQFVRRLHIDSTTPFEAPAWRWLVPHLNKAMENAPGVVTPQVCQLLTRPERSRIVGGPERGRPVTCYHLDEKLLAELAEGEAERRELLGHLASAPDPGHDQHEQYQATVSGVRADAIALLTQGSGSGAARDLARREVAEQEPGENERLETIRGE
jgi:hypothetical protein